ncbi:MAG: UDP-N-acetylglucosamine 1-carboxyvinyltransferase [Patescibacteria group bacterium]
MNLKVAGGQVLQGEITPSGSKNSVVALLPASLLFDKPLTIKNVPQITDVDRLVAILTHLGSRIDWDKSQNTMTIDNSQVKFDPIDPTDVNSTKGIRGTTLLWGPMLARFKKAESSEQPAGCTLGFRPIDAHFQAFKDLGIKVQTTNNHVHLDSTNAKSGPVWLTETSPTATENIIMLAVTLPGRTTIVHAACEPNVQQLCSFLASCGAEISGIGSSVLTISGGRPLTPVEVTVMPDIYEIGTFLALGAVTGGRVSIKNSLPQYFTAINREFARFGINITYSDDTAIVEAGQKPRLFKLRQPLIVRAQPWPALPVDMLPLFIPLALAAPSGQVMFHNWMYESGLFWTSELAKMGANIVMCDPHRVLAISGNPLTGAVLDAPYIIRAVVSMVMAAMIAHGETVINNADSIHRGHPNFVANLKKLGAKIEEIL